LKKIIGIKEFEIGRDEDAHFAQAILRIAKVIILVSLLEDFQKGFSWWKVINLIP